MRQTVYFDAPYRVALHSQPVGGPGNGEVLVQTRVSAISAGTEMLFYRGRVPQHMQVDTSIADLQHAVTYPLAYGYSAVGTVIECGPDVPDTWLGQTVFAFQPHTTYFLAKTADLHPLPPGMHPESAVFLPNMETAVNLVMDGRPLLGERIVVLGQGVVGLLVTALLAQFPLGLLLACDDYTQRLDAARTFGAQQVARPDALPAMDRLDPDLLFELTGNPAALASAVAIAGFGTRIIVGSWYGDTPISLPLGGSFHRNRVQIISSQVSTLDGALHNRWSKTRRFATAWHQLQRIHVRDLITHRLPLQQAPEAYRLLDEHPDQAIQILFTY